MLCSDAAELRVLLLIWIGLIVCQRSDGVSPIGRLLFDPSNIEYQIANNKDVKIKVNNLSDTGPNVKEAIKDKVLNLKQLLQDDDRKANKIHKKKTFESPKLPKILRGQIEPQIKAIKLEKYRKIKEKINRALRNDNASNKTKTLVDSTIEELISKIIENRCTWKRSDADNIFRAIIPRGVAGVRLGDDWTQHWESLKQRVDPSPNINGTVDNSKMFKFFDRLSKFYSQIINRINTISEKYKVECSLINKIEPHLVIQHDISNKTRFNITQKKSPCPNFQICSNELTEFLENFFHHLNDTVVSAFSNYAEMFVLDANNDYDKEEVHLLVKNMSAVVESVVAARFKKEVNSLSLDKQKDEQKNYRFLKDFVKITVYKLKKKLKKYIEETLDSLNPKTRSIVADDLNVNLAVDLMNLVTEIKSEICAIFATCKGKLPDGRRSGRVIESKDVGERVTKSNQNTVDNIHLKIKFRLNKNLNEIVQQRSLDNAVSTGKLNYYTDVQVTRTTLLPLGNQS